MTPPLIATVKTILLVLGIVSGACGLAQEAVNPPVVPPAQVAAPSPTPVAAPRRPVGTVIVTELTIPAQVRPPEEKDLAGYLMVYFKDQTHSAYFAISRDGYNFTDVNGGDPVFDGATLAEQKGVRDPHITRGPDGAFYLAMTDLHIFGKRAGFRET